MNMHKFVHEIWVQTNDSPITKMFRLSACFMRMTNLEHAVAHLEDSKFMCTEFFGEKFTCAYRYEVIFKYEAIISE